MANEHEDELLGIEKASAALAEEAMGYDPGALAQRLAGQTAASIGESVADKYARIGAGLLADPVATRIDEDMIDRLASAGFDRRRLGEVRIHRGLKASAAADALGARAFAIGSNDVFFGRGEYDPSTRVGRAVLAHEVAHIAPPSSVPSGGVPTGYAGGAPVLNERRRGDDDAAGEERHEQVAREAEGMIYAQEDSGGGPAPTTIEAPAQIQEASSPAPEVNIYALEAKVMGILSKIERTEVERRGRQIDR